MNNLQTQTQCRYMYITTVKTAVDDFSSNIQQEKEMLHS